MMQEQAEKMKQMGFSIDDQMKSVFDNEVTKKCQEQIVENLL